MLKRNLKIGQKLRQARIEAELTTYQLARSLNCFSSYIYNIENGNIIISAEIIGIYAEYFNKSADWFLDTQEESPANIVKYINDIKNPDIRKNLLEMLYAINEIV